jgi:hypothetical protein
MGILVYYGILKTDVILLVSKKGNCFGKWAVRS